ncbi:MAG: NADH-quinone oxidoreductase subunit N [Planctomycetes bacterium]|nr:NADH-quinone oxidoreductase subunit N [Planctomycetota bacterium]
MTALGALLPSILLTAGVLAVLFADAAAKGRRPLLLPWISGTALVAVAAVAVAWLAGDRLGDRVVLGALRMDAFTAVLTLFCAVAGLVSILATLVGDGNSRPGGEFHALVLCAVVGMSVLAAAVDMVTLYLAFELVSITGYVLVGMRRADRLANEAAMKYVLFGAVSSGLMVYGLSLLFGLAGGTSLEALRAAVVSGASSQPVFVAAVVLVFAGFAFKVSAAPFHFWAPDVYQGAPTAVAGFLSVASKAAGFAGLVRVVLALGAQPATAKEPIASFLPWGSPVAAVLAVAAVLTMTVGNLAACRQKDLKRLLAYSSIAHAGYMLMALAVWTPNAMSALVFYLVTYLFMNLAAFLFAGIVVRATGSSSIDSLHGLGFRNPWLAAAFTLVMLSLTGIPPMLGFLGKLVLFESVLREGWVWFAVIGLLNGAISLYYYALPLRRMYLEGVAEGAPPVRLAPGAAVLAAVLVLPVVAFFLWWSPLADWARTVVPSLRIGS